MRVAIVGGPGIGKSTLLRQLGDLYHHGSYGEGEEGVWDSRVLADIEAGRNAVGVTTYFARLYDANYRDAADHDKPGRVIFFEGARITLEAHITEYPAQHHASLQRVLAIGDWWNPDRVIVLRVSIRSRSISSGGTGPMKASIGWSSVSGSSTMSSAASRPSIRTRSSSTATMSSSTTVTT
jgi:energy-coupling factor transporter ATP-binding protein EcfA2